MDLIGWIVLCVVALVLPFLFVELFKERKRKFEAQGDTASEAFGKAWRLTVLPVIVAVVVAMREQWGGIFKSWGNLLGHLFK